VIAAQDVSRNDTEQPRIVTMSSAYPFRLIVVTNRGPYRLAETKQGLRLEKTVGGLTTALLPLLEKTGGLWIASGEPPGQHANASGHLHFDLRYIELTSEETENYYYGFSNNALWPLCHYFLGRVEFRLDQWGVYEQVNQKFAQATLEEAQPTDVIWVHDYHLARVPLYLRQARPSARLAFFWHIPFPSPEIFRALPWRKEILISLLACDLVGFHIPEYAENFGAAAIELLGATVEGDEIRYAGHITRVIARPIGIDYAAVEKEARSRRADRRAKQLRETIRGQMVIVGVERMDYTKGVLERLRGMERLLELKPEWHGKVSLIQIVTPSREGVDAYREKKREIDEIVGRVNGRFSSDVWTPIHYAYRAFSPAQLIVYYRAADIALVTPLRDGLNLVAKEYVASRVHQDGVLILSEFAGVRFQLPDALMVNPYSVDDMANVLEQALQMPKEEQRRRMQAMQARIKTEDLSWWAKEFLDRMSTISQVEPVQVPA